jgi:hypothetical protein
MKKSVAILSAILIFFFILHPAFAILGDVNNDGHVDMKDIRLIAKAFGATPGSSTWNPECDLDGNQIVDIRDVRLAATNFGK